MLAFVLRRVLQSAIVMAVVAFIAFGLFNFTGDPVQFMVGQDTTLEERARLRAVPRDDARSALPGSGSSRRTSAAASRRHP